MMIHYLYVGHFERDGDFIKFKKVGSSRPALHRPVVSKPLDIAIIQEQLDRKGITPETIPPDWGLKIDDSGFISCDRNTHSADAIEFIRELAIRTHCDIADYSALTFLRPQDLALVWEVERVAGTSWPPLRQAHPNQETGAA